MPPGAEERPIELSHKVVYSKYLGLQVVPFFKTAQSEPADHRRWSLPQISREQHAIRDRILEKRKQLQNVLQTK